MVWQAGKNVLIFKSRMIGFLVTIYVHRVKYKVLRFLCFCSN